MRDVLLSSLVGAYVQEDVSSGGGGEARRNTVQGPHAEGPGDRNAVQTTVSVNIFFYLFMVYTCMHIFLL